MVIILLLFYTLFNIILVICSTKNNTKNFTIITCNSSNEDEQCITMPKKPSMGEYVIADKYKINTCITGKTFSSMQLGIFCYLYDQKKFLSSYLTKIDKAGDRRLCGRENRYKYMNSLIKEYANNNSTKYFDEWNNILVVRDPISRFISGFVQLCVLSIGLPPNHPHCFHCGRDIDCFLSHLYTNIKKIKKSKREPVYFIKYHFYPQTWQCQYYIYKEHYKIIYYSMNNKKKFYSKYLNELKQSNIPKRKIRFIKKLLKSTKTLHTTYDKKESTFYKNILMNSKKLLKLIVKIFYDDYREFKFKWPRIKE
uniref:Sulfotransferase domain-containing protein n=2 Tax=Strongyloides stercoralis TaxID=6248 RepID=A0A0K0DWM0_STRER